MSLPNDWAGLGSVLRRRGIGLGSPAQPMSASSEIGRLGRVRRDGQQSAQSVASRRVWPPLRWVYEANEGGALCRHGIQVDWPARDGRELGLVLRLTVGSILTPERVKRTQNLLRT